MRCPRQWQDRYVHKREGGSSEALLLGGYVHLMLSHALKGETIDAKNALDMVLIEQGGAANIVTKPRYPLDLAKVEGLGLKMVYDYYETIGKWLEVEDTEIEVKIEVPGVDIPVVGFIDFTTPDRIVDVKTTGYFNPKQVRLNPEWKFQANVYQLHQDKPAEFHVITRAKSDSIRVPTSINDPLYVYPPDRASTERQVAQVYSQIKHCWETWGDAEPWPGGVTHEWAGKYCGVPNCCQR